MGLVGAVVVVDATLVAVGYALLAPFLRTRALRTWVSYAGVALLAGAAVVFVVLCIAAVAGAHTGLGAFAVVTAAVFAAGVAATLALARRTAAAERHATAHEGATGDLVAVVCATGVAIVVVAAVVGGFRTAPWLDDSWFMWLPKGMALDRVGLDLRLFSPGHGLVAFTSPGYPWWWSIFGAVDVRAAGSVDLRLLDAQLALLFAAFVATAARLLWGRVRPSLLWAGLLLLVAAPELLRLTQSGGADVPVAIFVAAAALAAVRWLQDGEPLHLALVAAFAAAAVQIKDEGLPQLALVVAALAVFAWRAAGPHRVASLVAAAAAGAATAVPWLVWRSVHHVPSELSLGEGLHRLGALDQRSRLSPVTSTILHDVFSPRQWLVLVPLALVLAVAAAAATRRLLPLALPAFVGLELLFWIWVYWSAPAGDVTFRLTTSAYRVVAASVLVCAATLPLLAEALAASPLVRRAVERVRPASAGAAHGETSS
jgi:hypothetical protein